MLVYLKVDDSLNLLNYFNKKFNNVILIEYEVINPFDEFGKRMKENLFERNCVLFGIEDSSDVNAHVNRFVKTGFNNAEVYDMLSLYDKIINKEEKLRVEKIEMMDEFEEWNLIQTHYCFGIGIKAVDKEHENLAIFMKLENL